MATLIGLCIRTKLLRSLPPRFKVDIQVRMGACVFVSCVSVPLAGCCVSRLFANSASAPTWQLVWCPGRG